MRRDLYDEQPDEPLRTWDQVKAERARRDAAHVAPDSEPSYVGSIGGVRWYKDANAVGMDYIFEDDRLDGPEVRSPSNTWIVPKVPDDPGAFESDADMLNVRRHLVPDGLRSIAATLLARADALEAQPRVVAVTAEGLADRILGAAFERGATDPLLIAKGLLAEFHVTRRTAP